MMIKDLAEQNFKSHLLANVYPGRGIVQGLSESGEWLQIYWIMGRSEQSRNRVFVQDGPILRTQAADPSKVKDPSLIIYNAMKVIDFQFVVTNGSQTDGIAKALQFGQTFENSHWDQRHEPDAPNFTPRISGYLDLRTARPRLAFSILRRSPFHDHESEHQFTSLTKMERGFAYGITTYQGDGNPLPTFVGSPLLLPVFGEPEQILERYWNALNADNRIAIALKSIDPKNRQTRLLLKNQYSLQAN